MEEFHLHHLISEHFVLFLITSSVLLFIIIVLLGSYLMELLDRGTESKHNRQENEVSL